MTRHNVPDIAAGLIVAAVGVAVALYAWQYYPVGTFRRMGPGMFPVGLGMAIALLGSALAAVAVLKPVGEWEMPELQRGPALLVLAGVVAFALLIRTTGLFPAVVAVVAISAFADTRANLFNVAVLSAVLSAIAFAIFSLALGMNFRLLEWPF